MITYGQALVLGLLQGFSELFPISSLGHSVLIPALLHWQLDEHSQVFILFLVATHLATALVLLIFFWKDWMEVISGLFRLIENRDIGAHDTYARLAWLLIIATIPAGLIGLLFQKKFEALFAAPKLVAIVLILNGLLLFGVELVKRSRRRFENLRNTGDAAIVKISSYSAFGAGIMQALALIPGFSRTGASLAGGLLAGLGHESAARFSFLLATPIILAAAVLKLPTLLHVSTTVLMPILFGGVVSAIAAFLSLTFLVRYFKTNTLIPFAWYCVVAGSVSFLLLLYS
jgi:undecaprenyl-diphosphatase